MARTSLTLLLLAACCATALTLFVSRPVAADRDTDRLLAAIAAGLIIYEALDDDYSYGYCCPPPHRRYRPPSRYDCYWPPTYAYRPSPWRYDYSYRPWSWYNVDRYRHRYDQPPNIIYVPPRHGWWDGGRYDWDCDRYRRRR